MKVELSTSINLYHDSYDNFDVAKKYYLSNTKILPELKRCKEIGKISEELAVMLVMMARRYVTKGQFSGYTYRDDMISEALINLCKHALKFDIERYDNPFAYFTQCIHNSFLQTLNREKVQRQIRDELLIDIDENPSYNYTVEAKQQIEHDGYFKTEIDELSQQIADARIRKAKEETELEESNVQISIKQIYFKY